MALRAQEISQEAGSKIAQAMKDVINAAAGIAGFAVESARDVVQYMVRRGQMTQEEADRIIREAEEAHSKRKPTAKPAAAAPAVAPAPVPHAPPAHPPVHARVVEEEEEAPAPAHPPAKKAAPSKAAKPPAREAKGGEKAAAKKKAGAGSAKTKGAAKAPAAKKKK